ncbi:hypothetical protein ACFQPA_00955 [Halomarina halobia]|uniref:DUF1102 domain-containing protein n=1 Tax=Halomarina halobia TaxID=3033386 RepID=A0ABD6A7E2_9EURY|nr:hypothetical protein [Halomarina sp. PSR21]
MSDPPDPETRESRPRFTRRRLLGVGAGTLAAAVAVPATSGVAAAHFPDRLDVDVRPRSDRNVVPARGRGVVPVAAHRTTFERDGERVVFDPTTRPEHYRFGAPDVLADGGGARPVRAGRPVDLDGDGDDSLLLLFRADEAGFEPDDDVAELRWAEHAEGEHGYSGTDEVTVVGRR